MVSIVSLLGTAQLTLFNLVAGLARGTRETAAPYILGLSLGVVGLTAGIGGFTLYNYFVGDNFGGLLGFSLGCFLLYTLLTSVVRTDARAGFKFFNFIKNTYKWIYIVQFAVLAASTILMGLFPNLNVLSAVISFISNIFSVVPTLMGAYTAGLSLTAICGIGRMAQSGGIELSTGYKIFLRSFEIYKKMIFSGAIVGFLLLMTKFGFGIANSFNT